MGIKGYLELEDIGGESRSADHENQVDIFGVEWKITQRSSASVGSGRTRSRAEVSDFTFYKYYDAASPYLALVALQAKSLATATLNVRKDSGDAHLDYLTIELTDCIVSGYEMFTANNDPNQPEIMEKISISCENVKIKYTVQADDHSAGDEHEVEYNLVAGK